MPRVPPVLGKRGSGAFKSEWERALRVLDLPRLCVVLEGALDRKALEAIVRKALRGRALRPGALPRAELVAAVAEGVRLNPDIAWLAMRDLDKSCQKERHIVASMDDDNIEVRLTSYRAIDFRRERARLIWALVRDGRDTPLGIATRLLDEHFAAVVANVREERATAPDAAGASPPESATPHVEAVRSLRSKVETYEEAISEQAEVLHKEKSERERLLTERSELLVRLGQKERALKAEEARRHEAEDEVRQLREAVHALKDQLERLDPERVRETQEERDQLRDRARALERKVAHAERMAELHDENVALREELAALRQEADRKEAENVQLLRQLATREKAAMRRADSLRESLKEARRMATAGSRKEPSFVEGDPVEERVGIFVDASNLAASARREGTGKFDFVRLRETLLGERKQQRAVAFVVEGGGEGGEEGFAAFTRALSAGGYEVRSKKARVRADGSRKADWDMGMAMEMLDARNLVDVIILCSGDGDFVPLVRKLKQWGKRVEVASHLASTDKELLRVADEHHDLSGRFSLR